MFLLLHPGAPLSLPRGSSGPTDKFPSIQQDPYPGTVSTDPTILPGAVTDKVPDASPPDQSNRTQLAFLTDRPSAHFDSAPNATTGLMHLNGSTLATLSDPTEPSFSWFSLANPVRQLQVFHF